MNNKDLFNAIHNVDENYIANAWTNTDADRPIILRPEKRSAKKTVRNIMLGVGGTAAAAAVGLAIFAGTNGFSLKSIIAQPNSAGSTVDFDPNAPLPVEVICPDGARLTYNDLVGASIGGDYLLWESKATAEEIAQMDELFENFDEIISKDNFEGFNCNSFVYLPEPGTNKLKRYNTGDEYGGIKINHAYSLFDINRQYKGGGVFLDSFERLPVEITLKEEATLDNANISADNCFIFTSNDPSLTDVMGGLIDGELRGTVCLYTDLPKNTPIKVTLSPFSLAYSVEKASVYLHTSAKDFEPFNESLKQWTEKKLAAPSDFVSDDFSFLCYENVAKELGGKIYAVDDGEVIDATSSQIAIKHGEGLYTTYSLIDALVSKGDIVKAGDVIGNVYCDGPAGPEMHYQFTQEMPELMPVDNEFVQNLPGVSNLGSQTDNKLPIDLIGADGVKLTYKDLENATIYKLGDTLIKDSFGERYESIEITIDEIDQWNSIICEGFVYLAEPGATEFKRYNVGDKICGLTIKEAEIMFKRSDDDQADPALQYVRGSVIFDGSISVDVLTNGLYDGVYGGNVDAYSCAISGLPVIDMDVEAREQGKIVPKTHTAEEYVNDLDYLSGSFTEKYRCLLLGMDDTLKEERGTIIKNVEIAGLDIFWQENNTVNPRCLYTAFLK